MEATGERGVRGGGASREAGRRAFPHYELLLAVFGGPSGSSSPPATGSGDSADASAVAGRVLFDEGTGVEKDRKDEGCQVPYKGHLSKTITWSIVGRIRNGIPSRSQCKKYFQLASKKPHLKFEPIFRIFPKG